MDLKVGRDILDINEKDIILDNGACYQIITKEVGKLCETYSPIISKSLFSKLNKCGAVYTNEMLKKKAFERYHINSCTFWAFDMKKLEEFLK
mgnify:FL=1|jgi:hypothetical protein